MFYFIMIILKNIKNLGKMRCNGIIIPSGLDIFRNQNTKDSKNDIKL